MGRAWLVCILALWALPAAAAPTAQKGAVALDLARGVDEQGLTLRAYYLTLSDPAVLPVAVVRVDQGVRTWQVARTLTWCDGYYAEAGDLDVWTVCHDHGFAEGWVLVTVSADVAGAPAAALSLPYYYRPVRGTDWYYVTLRGCVLGALGAAAIMTCFLRAFTVRAA